MTTELRLMCSIALIYLLKYYSPIVENSRIWCWSAPKQKSRLILKALTKPLLSGLYTFFYCRQNNKSEMQNPSCFCSYITADTDFCSNFRYFRYRSAKWSVAELDEFVVIVSEGNFLSNSLRSACCKKLSLQFLLWAVIERSILFALSNSTFETDELISGLT